MNASRSSVQQCPICRAKQPLEATRCSNCGAALDGLPIPVSAGSAAKKAPRGRRATAPLDGPVAADWDHGETDLYEGALHPMPFQGLVVIACALVVVAIIGVFIFSQVATSAVGPPPPPPRSTETATDVPTAVAGIPGTPLPTNTKSIIDLEPTLPRLATVTPAPPTPTVSPTRGPCVQKAAKGDTVYGMAARCGHRDMGIVSVILDINNMKDAGQLQIGQSLQIPWPTPTGGAAAAGSGGGTATPGGAAIAESTLPAGVTWYKVRKNDTAVSIAFNFHTTMKTLQDLNPEIQFLQCDFGLPGGGPACTLKPMLGEGQKVRVPAPTPTPTLSPTLSGSETATPTATATFNAPFSQLPSDNMLFEASELPTLRWVASGQLGPNEVYLVTVRDTNTSLVHTASTRDLSFQIPADWQPTDGKRHVFEWSVAVASKGDNGTTTPSAYTTETRTFQWQAR